MVWVMGADAGSIKRRTRCRATVAGQLSIRTYISGGLSQVRRNEERRAKERSLRRYAADGQAKAQERFSRTAVKERGVRATKVLREWTGRWGRLRSQSAVVVKERNGERISRPKGNENTV